VCETRLKNSGLTLAGQEDGGAGTQTDQQDQRSNDERGGNLHNVKIKTLTPGKGESEGSFSLAKCSVVGSQRAGW
jgi:hypothetical protein